MVEFTAKQLADHSIEKLPAVIHGRKHGFFYVKDIYSMTYELNKQ